MPSFSIVTDSTADLSSQETKECGAHIVPLWVQFGTETLRDGEEIDQEGWQKRFSEKLWPTTSQPPAGEFLECYRRLEGDILSVHISAGLSGTVQSARTAAADLPGRDIRVVDSTLTSAGLGYQVMAAARTAAAGGNLDEALQAMERVRERVTIHFMVDSLAYLQKGGRIGRAQAWAGIALQIKPLLQLEDGLVQPMERVRTRAQALKRLVDLCAGQDPERISVLHFLAGPGAAELSASVREATGITPEVRAISCVLGTHIGPGTLGLVTLRREG